MKLFDVLKQLKIDETAKIDVFEKTGANAYKRLDVFRVGNIPYRCLIKPCEEIDFNYGQAEFENDKTINIRVRLGDLL